MMHSHSLLSIFALLALWSDAVLSHKVDEASAVVVWVTSTITTCPSPPPPPSCFESGTEIVTTELPSAGTTSETASSGLSGPSGSGSSAVTTSVETTSSLPGTASHTLVSSASSSFQNATWSGQPSGSSTSSVLTSSEVCSKSGSSVISSSSSSSVPSSATSSSVANPSASFSANSTSSVPSGPSSSLPVSSSSLSSSVSTTTASSLSVSSSFPSSLSSSLSTSSLSSLPVSSSSIVSSSVVSSSVFSSSTAFSSGLSSSSILSNFSSSSSILSSISSTLSSTLSLSSSSSSSSFSSTTLSSSASSSSVSSTFSSSVPSSTPVSSSTISSSASSSESLTISSSSSFSSTLSSSSTISSSTSSSISSSSSTPSPTCGSFFLENVKHQGVAPYAGSSDYVVFRNVRDFGAQGDGVHDDTAAINRAISATSNSSSSGGERCGPTNCQSTTTQPAVVYFPAGTYLVSAPIVDYYFTQLIGDPVCVPVIKAASNFTGVGSTPYSVIDGDLEHLWTPVNIFWRQVRNFVVDTTAVAASVPLAGVHWATGQATSLQNLEFRLSAAADTQHQGVYSEEGSGGFLTDLVFHGGLYGLNFGNQQYTMRNLTFDGCQTAVRQLWDWSWLYKGLSIRNCTVGLDLTAGAPAAAGVDVVIVVDSDFADVGTAVKIGRVSGVAPSGAGQLLLDNVAFADVDTAVEDVDGNVVLAGADATPSAGLYGVGAGYEGQTAVNFSGAVGHLQSSSRPAGLVGSDGRLYERSKPQYADLPASAFLSVRDAGAMGDGTTDDTRALQAAITAAVAADQVLFVDFGIYVVTDTLVVPPGARIVGEGYPVILSSGAAFADMAAPRAVVQVGTPGSVGTAEISDLVVSTRGAQAGAVLIEWQLSGPEGQPPTAAGLWDVHTRIGGFTGSQLQLADCPLQQNETVTAETVNPACIAAFLSLHVVPTAARAYFENVWLWVADHDAEDAALTQITVYAGRGVLLEGSDLLLYGTAAEHHVLYQYHVHDARDVVLGLIQTETAYYQPNPDATVPFAVDPAYSDPTLASGQLGWGALYSGNTAGVLVYGAGHYSFFRNNDKACEQYACQQSIVSVQSPAHVTIFGLVTTGTTYMLDEDGTAFAEAEAAQNYGNFMGVVGFYTS